MAAENKNFPKTTVGLQMNTDERLALDEMLLKTGLKKQAYVRNVVLEDLRKNGWLAEESNLPRHAKK